MLIAMRRGAGGWIAKILFGLLILSFAAWGIGDYLTPEADPVVAEVGDIEIRRTALDRAERRQLEQLRQTLGERFDASDLPEGTLRNAALDQLIGRAALDMEALTLGIGVSDAALAAAIRANPQFQRGDAFDPELFRRALFAAGMSEEEYVRSLRSDLARAQLGGAVAATLPPPRPVAEALFMAERQQRAAAYVRADTGGVTAPEPTEEQLRQYVQSNPDRFVEPERRDVRAIVVTPDAIAEATEISDADVANRYEDAKAQYAEPERRVLLQALFQDAEAARAFRQTAPTEPEAFAAEARTLGAAVTELGRRARGEIFPSALAEGVFQAEAGAVAPMIQTPLGWHVVLVREVQPEQTAPLEEVQDELRRAMQMEGAEDRVLDTAYAVEDALAAGQDLEAASQAAGIPIVRFEGIDRQGVDAGGAPAATLPEGLLEEAFARPAGEPSGLIELDDGSFVALVVDEVAPAQPKAFEAAREEARSAWQADERQRIAAERIQALTEANSLAEFEEAAAAADLSVQRTQLVTRQELSRGAALPPAFVEAMFGAREGETVRADVPGAVMAGIVTEVVRPTFDPAGETEQRFMTELAQMYAEDRIEGFARLVRETHAVEVAEGGLAPLEQN